MKFYIVIALAIAGCISLCVFYRFSYQQGYQTCQFENQQHILAALQKEKTSREKAQIQKQTLTMQLERKKEDDQICSDILNFDVRPCLSTK